MKIPRRIRHILIAFDQLLWVVITAGAGYPDETISSAVYRANRAGKWYGVFMNPINWMFLDPKHCRKAYLSEKRNTHLPEDFDV